MSSLSYVHPTSDSPWGTYLSGEENWAFYFAGGDKPDAENQGRGVPNYLGAPVISPDGVAAWVPGKLDNIRRGALRDGLRSSLAQAVTLNSLFTGNAAFDVAQGDLVGHQHGGFQAGAASLLNVKGRCVARQRGGEHRFAHQVEVAGMLHHGTTHHFAQALAVQVEAVHQALQRGQDLRRRHAVLRRGRVVHAHLDLRRQHLLFDLQVGDAGDGSQLRTQHVGLAAQCIQVLAEDLDGDLRAHTREHVVDAV